MSDLKIAKIEAKQIRKDLPNFKVGDTIEVASIIREGDKQRIQRFRGLVLAVRGNGVNKSFTVRKISYGVGVEKIFPWNSPSIESIKVLKHGQVRRSKIYYMRGRIGKLAMKVKPGQPAPVIEHAEEAQEVLEPTEAQIAEGGAEVQTDEVSADQPEVEAETVNEEAAVEPAAEKAEEAEAEEAPAE